LKNVKHVRFPLIIKETKVEGGNIFYCIEKKKIIKKEKRKFTHSKEKVNRKGKLKCSPSSHLWR
jgi:hypothetical protein